MISPTKVQALADLPPLEVMRARLLGTILAPASQLVRTLAEPARGLAAVVQALIYKNRRGSLPKRQPPPSRSKTQPTTRERPDANPIPHRSWI